MQSTTKNPLKVSIIIVNFNGLAHLKRCLSSVLNSDYGSIEIIVVDNASTDGSVEIIQEEFRGHSNIITLIPLRSNLGFSVGNNVGASIAKGEFLFLLNNDTEIDKDCIKEVVTAMEGDVSIGVGQPKILLMNRRTTFDSAGVFVNVNGFGRIRGLNEEDHGQYNVPYEISYAKGAAFIVRRSVWTQLGGFEPLFFAYFEETDFCLRVWLAGYRVVFIPHARVFHVGAATISKGISQKFRFQDYRNRIVMVAKILSLKNLVKYMPWLAVVYLNRIRLHIRDKDFSSVLANLKAVVWSLRFFKVIWAKRLAVQQNRKVSDETLFERGIISKSLHL